VCQRPPKIQPPKILLQKYHLCDKVGLEPPENTADFVSIQVKIISRDRK